MTEEEFARASAELDEEARSLRDRLHTLEEIVHGKLLKDAEEHLGRIAAVERQIREIVLRLCDIEREKTDLRIVKAMA